MRSPLRSTRRSRLLPVNAAELLDLLISHGLGEPAPARGGASRAVLLKAGIEIGLTADAAENRLRKQWRDRVGTAAVRYLLVADDPDRAGSVLALGPSTHDAPVRSLNTKSLFDQLKPIASSSNLTQVEAARQLAEAVSLLDQTGIAGVEVRKLLTVHTLDTRLRKDTTQWQRMAALIQPITNQENWRTILDQLGYELNRRDQRGYLARYDGRPVAVIHPKQNAAEFSRLDREGRPPEGTLIRDCRFEGARYGILVHQGRFRLFDAESQNSTAEWLDIDAHWVDNEYRPLLALLSPAYLAEDGLMKLREESQAFGARLHKRLDECIRHEALPALAVGIQNWARGTDIDLTDDEQRLECERAALTMLFRILFILYAESSGFLPIDNYSYRGVALSTLVEEAAAKQEQLIPASTALWDRFTTLVKAMRNGNPAWGVPAYNGALFAQSEFEGAELLERMELADPEFGAVLIAVGHDKETKSGVDFSTLELGHLGHIYEALLSLRLSIADRPLVYDARKEQYLPVESDGEVTSGDLLWMTHEGGRKAGGVYYTPAPLVQHLIQHAVLPSFKRHLKKIKKLANMDPGEAAEKLFDFTVLDPACGSGHFLVQVVEALADRTVRFLANHPLPEVANEINRLREGASRGVVIDDVSLLRRLMIKRCVFGVDISQMGSEIAALSLWLASFVPGLSLSHLGRNVVVGNSLIGVIDPATIGRKGSFWDEELRSALQLAKEHLARGQKNNDRTPEEVQISRQADQEAQDSTAKINDLFNLWTAEGFNLDNVQGSRNAVETKALEIISGKIDDNVLNLINAAARLSAERKFLHWPVVFPQIFLRENPGFDVVVGNPPWEEVRIERLEFFALYRPGISALSEGERELAIKNLLKERPELDEWLKINKQQTETERKVLASGEYEPMGADPDLYKYFCQRYRTLVRNNGNIGVVLPRGCFVNKGSRVFREWLFKLTTIKRIDILLNNRGWIFDIHQQKSIVLLMCQKTNPKADHKVRVAGPARSLNEWGQQSSDKGIEIASEGFGAGWITPVVRSQAESDVLSKVRVGNRFPYLEINKLVSIPDTRYQIPDTRYQIPATQQPSNPATVLLLSSSTKPRTVTFGPWVCFPIRELDENLDKHLWREKK